MRILCKLLARPNPPEHVLIETTGLADPAPVAQTFFVDDEVRAAYRLDAIVTVVDCLHVTASLDEVKPEGVENEAVVSARPMPSSLFANVLRLACP